MLCIKNDYNILGFVPRAYVDTPVQRKIYIGINIGHEHRARTDDREIFVGVY